MSDTKNIYQRINAVMKEVEYVQKDAEVQGYKAVTHDMVTAVLRKSMVEHGIVVRMEQTASGLLQPRDAEKGIKMHLYGGDYNVHFVNIDQPSDVATVTVSSHAADTGDKAPGKAASYAVKYAMLKIFSLETGENEEARFADPYSPEQFEQYHELIELEKAYEFYMFCSALPAETVTGLYNSFPDGKKTAGKRAASGMMEQGRAMFAETVSEIQDRLAKQDISVIEVTDEMSPMEKKLLMPRLTKHEIEQLKSIKEASI